MNELVSTLIGFSIRGQSVEISILIVSYGLGCGAAPMDTSSVALTEGLPP
jgi:hypothetical protein